MRTIYGRFRCLVLNYQWCLRPGLYGRCPDAGRRDIFKESVKELLKWMKNEQTKAKLSKLICDYLNHHGKKTMQSLLHSPNSQYKTAAMIHNKLSWDNFLEGRIAAM